MGWAEIGPWCWAGFSGHLICVEGSVLAGSLWARMIGELDAVQADEALAILQQRAAESLCLEMLSFEPFAVF